jgi:hypothetical protein
MLAKRSVKKASAQTGLGEDNSFCSLDTCSKCKLQRGRFDECIQIWQRRWLHRVLIKFLDRAR